MGFTTISTRELLKGFGLRGAFLTNCPLFSVANDFRTDTRYQAHDLTGIGLQQNHLTGANFAGQNLTGASFFVANLSNADFSQANLTNATFSYATMTGANFTNAEVRMANLIYTGITAAQLYSTASYQAHDLTGIKLETLAGVNLAGQKLTNAELGGNLTNAIFSQANLTNAYAYQTNLSNADFSDANLENARFGDNTMTGATFAGAHVRGASFAVYGYGSGITPAQLYSTASYQEHDLTGIRLEYNALAGVNLAQQNLTGAVFYGADLSGANLSQANLTGAWLRAALTNANFTDANLTNADFSDYDGGANLTGANLSGADARGANFQSATLTNANLTGADARGANFAYATLDGANTSNLIQSNGHIAGLDISAGESLVIRDYDEAAGGGLLPIVVDQRLAMDAAGALRLLFDADPWDSTISFAAGIPVTRGGTLELAFSPDVNLTSQLGRTIDLFDWTGVAPTGAFTVSSPYAWNLSNLYTTGEVTLVALPAIPGDFNLDGTVDAADYVVWRDNLGAADESALNGNGDGLDGVDGGDYALWKSQFGATASHAALEAAPVPEPASALLVFGAILCLASLRREERKLVAARR